MNGLDPADFASAEEKTNAIVELVADVGNYKNHP
jgi:hypothetical protein